MQGRYDPLTHVPKATVEESFRLDVKAAREQGFALSYFRNACGRQALIVCPECGTRTRYLYRPPLRRPWQRGWSAAILPHAENWACARCHNLAFASSQRSGTVDAIRAARERDWQDFKRLCPDGKMEDFRQFQLQRHRHYNRRRAKKKICFGKFKENGSTIETIESATAGK